MQHRVAWQANALMAVGQQAGEAQGAPPPKPGNTIAELVTAITKEKAKVHVDIGEKIKVRPLLKSLLL